MFLKKKGGKCGAGPEALRDHQERRPRPHSGAAVPRQGADVGTRAPWWGTRAKVSRERGEAQGVRRVREGSGRRRHGTGLRVDWGPEEGGSVQGTSRRHVPGCGLRGWPAAALGAVPCGEDPGHLLHEAVLPSSSLSTVIQFRHHLSQVQKELCYHSCYGFSRIRLLLSLCNLYHKADTGFHVKGLGPGGQSPGNVQVIFPECSLSSARMEESLPKWSRCRVCCFKHR